MSGFETTIHQKKAIVAMSGGVDSSVTAALLKQKGYAVEGVFMALAQPELAQHVARVKGVAEFLGIPLEVVDLSGAFKKEVLDYFAESYFSGMTPNPCVVCNRMIKCGKLLAHVLDRSADMLATGHYARIERGPEGDYQLRKGRDPKKDQSYFLCWLTQQQLARLIFPLGELTKQEVYKIAAGLGLDGRYGSESQDICFLKDQSVSEFLTEHYVRETAPGPVVTVGGEVIGRHQGIHHYTVGQRRGLGIPDATPYYVVALDRQKNTVIVGKQDDLFRNCLTVRKVNWIRGRQPDLPQYFDVRIRYRHQAARAKMEQADGEKVTVRFEEPQRAITPGQFAAFYLDDVVLGGGEIADTCE